MISSACFIQLDVQGFSLQTYDLKRPLNLPVHNRERMEEVLEADRQEPLHRNDWKNKEMAAGEEVGWTLWEEASTRYFRFASSIMSFCRAAAPITACASQR